ncbi:MAG: hypothetical protein AAF250_03850 [Pseudomonadota bacterium]
MTNSALAIALTAASSLAVIAAAPLSAQQTDRTETEFASKTLASGNQTAAIAALEAQREAAPEDPGVLINLGIAYAHLGDDQKAASLFEAALVSSDPIELETADGNLTDSRRLARKAMRMLAQGEFRPAADRLTLRE